MTHSVLDWCILKPTKMKPVFKQMLVNTSLQMEFVRSCWMHSSWNSLSFSSWIISRCLMFNLSSLVWFSSRLLSEDSLLLIMISLKTFLGNIFCIFCSFHWYSRKSSLNLMRNHELINIFFFSFSFLNKNSFKNVSL